MKRRKYTQFWTCGDLAAWIAANVPLSIIPASERVDTQWAIDKARWFWAYRQAEGFCDFRRKDFASLIVDGMPKLTYRDVSRELQDAYTETSASDTDVSISESFERELREFWLGRE